MKLLAKGSVDLEQLAKFTETPIEQVVKAAIVVGRPKPGSITDEYISLNRWRFCPLCVKEQTPHQRAWLLPFYTACPEHGCQLIDECHECGEIYSPLQMLNRFCIRCQKPAHVVDASKRELECSGQLLNLVDDSKQLENTLNQLMAGLYLTTPACLRPHHRASPQLKTVSEMREIVERIWPACSTSSHLKSAINVHKQQLLNKWANLRKLPELFIKRALESGAQPFADRESGSKQQFELSGADWWLPINEAAYCANTSAHVLKKLTNNRQIETTVFNEKVSARESHRFIMVSLNSLDNFITELLDYAVPDNGEVSLTHINNYSLETLVDDIFSEKLTLYYRKEKDINNLWVINAETSQAEKRLHKPANVSTAAEAAKALGTYHDVIADLTKHQLLESHSSSSRTRLFVTNRSIQNFNKHYIVVGMIANQFQVNSTNLAEKLSKLSIKPISNKTLISVYKKTAIASVKREDIIAIEGYSAKTGRKASFDEASVESEVTKKLIRLVNEYGGLTAFTRKFGYSSGTLSLMLREKKSFGPLAARRMEDKVGLAQGWFYS